MAKTGLLCFALLLVYGGVTVQESGPCTQVRTCYNLPDLTCSQADQQMQCISDLRGTCEVKEDVIFFDDLLTTIGKVCEEVDQPRGVIEVHDCGSAMGQCMAGSEISKKVRESAGSLEKLQKIMLDSYSWCQLLEARSRCYVNNVDACQLNSSVSELRVKQKELSAICGSGRVGPHAQGLLLMLGSLVCWSLLHL